MLPDPEDIPTKAAQRFEVLVVAFTVARDLFSPEAEGPVSPDWETPPVPEIAINENRNLQFLEYEIGTPRGSPVSFVIWGSQVLAKRGCVSRGSVHPSLRSSEIQPLRTSNWRRNPIARVCLHVWYKSSLKPVSQMRAISKGKPWSREELIVVCNLYFSLPFGQMHARNPSVIAMARALGRTPGSVAMKLVNFASLDPAHRSRGIAGLTGVSRADKGIWEEFHTNWSALADESEKRLRELHPVGVTRAEKQKRGLLATIPSPERSTEATASVRVRRTQSFFRRVVLAAYDWRCCITGNPVPELLIASHILPWSEFPKERVNPRNGLCLAAHFDNAFDQGLITFSEDSRVVLSSELRAHLPDRAIEREFISMEGARLRMPERFPPCEEFLTYHRTNIFRA